MQFISSEFSFNGINSDSIEVCLISFDNDTIKEYGEIYNKPLSNEGNLSNTPFYSEKESKEQELVLNIMLKDSYGNAKQWSRDTIQSITDWIITDNFVPFISMDDESIVYYIKCTSIIKKMTSNNIGYLECTFSIFDNVGIVKVTNTVNTPNSIMIDNSTNIREICFPKLTIMNLGNEGTINSISVAGKTFEIKGLKAYETVIVDNQLCTVFSGSENKIGLCNRKWLKLPPGVSKLTTSGNCRITIEANIKVGV